MDVARLLIMHGMAVMAQSKDGMTPLYHASEEGHVGVTCLLIDHGADVTAQSRDGMTRFLRCLKWPGCSSITAPT